MVSSAAGKLIHGAGDGVGVERAVAVAVCVGLRGNVEVGTPTVGLAGDGCWLDCVAETQALKIKTIRIKLLGIFIISSQNNE